MVDIPLVSIVIPVYNAEIYVEQAVVSAVNQTYANVEIVCVDDCSTDKSLVVLKDLESRYKMLRVVSLPVNMGAPAARNVGIKCAKGEYILPLDADDFIDHNYCRIAMDVFVADPSISVVYSRCMKFDDQSCWEWNLPVYSEEEMIGGNCVPVSAFFKKSDWKLFGGYDERLKALEDYDFWLYFTESGLVFYRIDECLLYYRQHASLDGITALFNGNIFIENTTRLQLYLNHKKFFREYFETVKFPEPDSFVETKLLNFFWFISVIEKKRRYTKNYRKISAKILGVPVVSLVWRSSKFEFLLLGLVIYSKTFRF